MEEHEVKLILKEGMFNGIVECRIDAWAGIAYKVPRNKLNIISKIKSTTYTGVYILFGENRNEEKKAYIGQAKDILDRLKQQNRDKDFWNEVIFFVDKANEWDRGNIDYIESKLINIAKKNKRFSSIENDVNPIVDKNNTVGKIAVKNILLLTSILGYNIFDEILEERERQDQNILYLVNNKKEYARGIMTDEGFVILKNSILREGISDKISPSLLNFVQRERKSKDIRNGKFVKDHLCSSPSMAGVIILGQNCNGYNTWKNKYGKKLRDIIQEDK